MAKKIKLSINQQNLQDEKALLKLQKERLADEKTLHHMQEKKLKRIQSEIAHSKTLHKEQEAFGKSYLKLNSSLKKVLSGQNNDAKTYLGLGNSIARAKADETKYSQIDTDDARAKVELARNRQSVLGEINSDYLTQAKATQQSEDKLKGISSLDAKIRDFRAEAVGFTKEELSLGEDALKQKDKQEKKQVRTNQLREQEGELLGMLPAGLQSAVGFAKKFGAALKSGMGPLFIIGAILMAALSSFIALEESAKKFREETGLTNSQMEDIRSQANQITQEFAKTGLKAEDVFNTVAALKSEFSDIAGFSDEVVAGLTLMNVNFGISTKSAAQVQGIFEQVGGLSSETATSVGMQAANMARLAGVAPAKIFEDIAENAEIASTFFHGDVEALTKAAVQARRLGTNLKSVASTTEHLLDFQSNIGDELVAATFVGGQFSLTQARSLAAAGKSIEANKEVLRQLERGGKFRDKDYFTQRQLAKAAGMSVEEINKQLNAQEKLSSLNDEQKAAADIAISQGLDISNINKDQLASQVSQFAKQKEMKSQVEALSAAFTAIAATVGSALTPLLQALMPIISLILKPITLAANAFKTIVNYIKESIPLMAALGAGAATYLFLKQKSLATDKQSAIFTVAKSAYETSYNAIVTVGNAIKKKGLLTAIAEMAMRAFTSIAAIPFIGPVLGVAAAAGALALGYTYYQKAGDVVSPADGKTRISTKEGGLLELSPNDDVLAGPGIASTQKGGGASDAKMNELIAAVKQTKDVYMDGRRVTSRVASSVEKSSKNQYGFG